MSRYRGAVCRHCKRENIKLFLKGDRCFTDKCAFERRSYAPGQHGQKRSKLSEYGIQLREKQKVRRLYGLSEKQFKLTFKKSSRMQGITGENFLQMLERRLDNVVYRLGFAGSRNQARQLVRHNHFKVNGRKTNIPSYIVKTGDVVELIEKSRANQNINDALASVERRGISQWLELEKDNYKGIVKNIPVREDITLPIQENFIVEFYSR
ncbi:MAG: 30S ribosomal protein S4 [Deltaproteobacteria bacterium]|nr:MAG: 30S ribosomal protein S4 [Deltaproteobacteria bacterium]PIE75265.1 MAG: 30S ribosomal protein S4 [Deltaproteobacteria bacterium]